MNPLLLGNIVSRELHLLWFVGSGKALSCHSLEAYNGLMKKPCSVYMMSLIIIIIIMILRMEMAQHVQRTCCAPSCKNNYYVLLHWSIKAFMCLQKAYMPNCQYSMNITHHHMFIEFQTVTIVLWI